MAAEGPQIKLMIVTPDPQAIVKHVPHLLQMNFRIEIETSISAASDRLVTGKSQPHAILLNWSLPNEEVRAFYTKAESELGTPCIVFSEDKSRKVNNELLKSRIPNVIFPPLSGYGIDRRIRQLLRLYKPPATPKKPTTTPPEDVSDKVSIDSKKMAAQIEIEKSTLEKRMKSSLHAVERYFSQNKPGLIAAQSKTLMVPVTWKNLAGYLILAQNVAYDHQTLNQLRQDVLGCLAEHDGIVTNAKEHVELDLNYEDIVKWSKDHAEIISSLGGPGGNMLVAFANLGQLPSLSVDVTEEYVAANLDGWLQLNSKLPFDLFIHLVSNAKFIHYMRKDALISPDVMERLNRVGTSRCFLEPQERSSLLKHCIEAKIRR